MAEKTARVALVTGGARGIGASIVERLANDGAHVVFTYAGANEAAQDLAGRLEFLGKRVLGIQADSADSEAVATVVATAVEQFGRLDTLVNNAGGGTFGELHEMPVEEIDKMIQVNIRGLVLTTRLAIPHLTAGGRIINIGSANAERTPFPGGSIYGMTKGAVASFTRGLSRELGPRGITVNNVQPGPIATDANPDDGPSADFLRGLMSLGRYGSVDDVSALVAFLASEEGKHITGTSVTIDGGFSA